MKLTKRNIGDWVTHKEWFGVYKVIQITSDGKIVNIANDIWNRNVENQELIIVKRGKKK